MSKKTIKITLKDKGISAKAAKNIKGGPTAVESPATSRGTLNFLKIEGSLPGGSINF